jgi:hypothetical protein
MKEKILLGAITLLAGSLLAADSNPQDAVKDAAKALGAKDNYSWKTTIDLGMGDMVGTIDGKAEKGGATTLTMSGGDQSMDAVLKGGKGVLKLDEGWKLLSEVATNADQGMPQRIVARVVQGLRAPAVEGADLAAKAKDLKLTNDVYCGDLTLDAIKGMLNFGPKSGEYVPEVKTAKGTVKFWLKDGVLSKYEFTVEGSVTVNGDEHEGTMKNTVQVKDIGTTKVTVPEEAAKKL